MGLDKHSTKKSKLIYKSFNQPQNLAGAFIGITLSSQLYFIILSVKSYSHGNAYGTGLACPIDGSFAEPFNLDLSSDGKSFTFGCRFCKLAESFKLSNFIYLTSPPCLSESNKVSFKLKFGAVVFGINNFDLSVLHICGNPPINVSLILIIKLLELVLQPALGLDFKSIGNEFKIAIAISNLINLSESNNSTSDGIFNLSSPSDLIVAPSVNHFCKYSLTTSSKLT